MRTIARHFDTLAAAEAFLDELYDEYGHVRLVRWPFPGESGTYAWEVKD